MKIKKFNQVITPDAKCVINIELINNAIIIDNKQFLSTYKISKIFKGKYFIKRLIKKIFKHQFNSKLIWNENFWNQIQVCQYSTKITYINPDAYNTMSMELIKSTKKNRMKDILKYKKLIINGYDLNSPLFITSAALNFLGANINNCTLILDGSRRLVANVFAEINPKILIIDLK